MKNFFQRTRSNSNAPANDAYRVWLPPADASRPAPPGPNQWIHASGQDSVRPRGEAPRSSSRARADASSVPTSSTYKYATVPPNSTGFYYPNNPGQPQSFPPPFPPQYYPPDRPDSRLGYVPYPYPNPQYPQSFTAAPPSAQPATSSRREDKKRNAGDGRRSSPVPAPAPAAERPPSSRKHSEKDDRARRPSSSSLREQKREEEAEVKKPKTKTRETSETRKRRDSQVGDSYAEKYRDQSSRKESRRDSKFRQNPRVEEGDSSDSSAQRPSSAAGYRRQLREGMRNRAQQEPIPFPAGSRVGLPLQPTAASSSSGKHTPQNPRMPVYLPTNQRRDEGQPGLSESDTDHGTLNRRRNFLRGTALGNAKQSKPSAPTPVEKKVKESKGLWPFSRSKSSQKLPQNAPPTPANIPSKKTRADSTPAKLPADSVPTRRPEYHRHASENAIDVRPAGAFQATPAPQEYRSRPVVPDVQSSTSRALFFATQTSESSSRPITTVSQQAALYPLRPRPEAPPGPERPVEHPPPAVTSSEHRLNPTFPAGTLHEQMSVGPNQVQRPETPLRRDSRDKSNLPPIYAPAVMTRTSDYPRNPDRSTTPKVSQLVAGFEARSSDPQTHVPQPAKLAREVVEKPSLPQIYPPPLQPSSQSAGAGLTSTRRPLAAANSHTVPSQPPAGKREERSHTQGRPVETSNVQARPMNQPDVLKTQLRDLLTDKSSTWRSVEKPPTQPATLPPESRLKQASAPPALHPTAKPPDWNPSSQLYAFSQPPVQVYSAGTSSIPFKSTAKSEKPVETPLGSNPYPTPSSSSRRPDVAQPDPVDRALRGGVSRLGDELRDVDRGHRQSSRPKKDAIGVMKTPSKDSSRHTSSPSPVILTHSTTPSRSNEKAKSAVLQPPSTSRSQSHTAPPDAQNTGRHEPSNVPLSSGDKTSQRDHRSISATLHSSSHAHAYDTPTISRLNAPPTISLGHSESSRGVPPASTRVFPNNPTLPVSSTIPPVRTSTRSAVPVSSETPPILPRSSTRSSVTPVTSSNSRAVPRGSSEESLLRTPSSIAPSVLHPSVSRTSIPASVASETRNKGIFGGMFRSKAAQQPQTPAFDVRHPNPSVKPTEDRRPQSSSETIAHPDRPRKVPPPITVPSPALPISDRKSPNSRGFTPFRYLTTKRNRRVSTASMDAEDGTAPNTVMGSPTASMQSSQMPTQSPPQRDPRVATQDWRNQEESDVKARGKPRRMRPGVVFDVAENPLEETKRSRPARIKKSQPQAQEAVDPPTTDSDA